MTIKEIVKMIAAKEGLKDEVSIGNIREIVGIISDLIVSDTEAVLAIVVNGRNRAKRKKSK